MQGLGRLISIDDRDLEHPIEAELPKRLPPRRYRYWNQNGWWGNQKRTSQCVAYAWIHWLEDAPIMYTAEGSVINPADLYKLCQENDEWDGENYDGTSVRAGAKVLQQMGYIGEYTWGFDLESLVNVVLTTSPVVVGTDWLSGMSQPNSSGLVKATGDLEGGHGYLVNGVNRDKRLFRFKNSWGRGWAKNGYGYISFDDMEKLINNFGEICYAKELKK